MKRTTHSKPNLSRLKSTFGNRAYMALIRRFSQNEHLRLHEVEEAARIARVPTVALGDILYHHPDRRPLQDVVTCIREGCTIDAAGYPAGAQFGSTSEGSSRDAASVCTAFWSLPPHRGTT